MITKNLNQKMVVSKTALLKAEREYLESFYSFKLSHDSDKTLMKDSRKNVLAIIEKSKEVQLQLMLMMLQLIFTLHLNAEILLIIKM